MDNEHPFNQITNALTEDQRVQIIADYEQFKEFGEIGDCVLREIAGKYSYAMNNHIGVCSAMDQIVMDCYKYFTKKYFDIFNIS